VVLDRCPKDIRGLETVRGRAGMPSTHERARRCRAASASARGGDCGGGDHQASKRGGIGKGEHRPGFLHFPKKLFVAKVARCDLSTAQVVVHICRMHFRPVCHPAFFCSPFNGFDTRDQAGSTLPTPICSRQFSPAMISVGLPAGHTSGRSRCPR
jgi:hypothetical protein